MSHLNARQRELVAIGASLASNCIPCIKFHVGQGRKVGLTDEEIEEAIEVGDEVRQTPARKVLEAAAAALGCGSEHAPNAGGKLACGGANDTAKSTGVADISCCGPGAGS